MSQALRVTLAKDLEEGAIQPGKEFGYNHVVDLRCGLKEAPRPIEESVAKRLANRFVGYTQMPIALAEAGPCQEIHLCEFVSETGGEILILTDDIGPVASLLALFRIPFESSVFYIVETGKGDLMHALPAEQAISDRRAAAG